MSGPRWMLNGLRRSSWTVRSAPPLFFFPLELTMGRNRAGAMFNSGQSCCGIERIYVHASLYDEFIDHFTTVARAYTLGDPRSKATNLGPVVSVASAERIRKQVRDAVAAGARELVGTDGFEIEKEGNAYVGPKVLVDVTHEMDVMMEEVGPRLFQGSGS
jgi:acyl-CoA reductase-like NAD-dependent aldehyde dehydrogenase